MRNKNFKFFTLFIFIALFFFSGDLLAATGGLPWESPLQTLRDSLQGPVAMSIAIIAIVVAGGMLIMGGELNEFARRMIMLVLVLAVLVAANGLLAVLYSGSSAVII